MKKTLLIFLLIIHPMVAYAQNKVIRDTSTNQDIAVWRQDGNRTYVSDPYSNQLDYTRIREGSRTYIVTPDNHEWAVEDYDD